MSNKNKNAAPDIQPGEKKKKRTVRTAALKQGGFAVAATAIVLAVVVVVNIIATTLYNKFPLDLDFTADKHFTVTEENEQYIKNIDKKITIYALSSEDTYADNLYTILSYNGVSGDVSAYARQTYEFMLKYTKLNSNIELEFVDPDQPDFQDIQTEFSDIAQNLNYCDLIISSEFEIDGEQVQRHKLVSYDDFFTLEYDYYGYSQTISGSNIESVLTSALYSVTSERTFYVGDITSHNTAATDNLTALLGKNNYETEEISNILTTDIDPKYDIILLCAPTDDFTAEEVDRLDKFLRNDGKYGKTLIYVADSEQAELPNLEEFLYEWGYTFKSGVLYETSSQYHLSGRDTEVLTLAEANDYVTPATQYGYYVSDGNKPVILEQPTSSSYSVESIVGFNDSTVIYPQNAGSDWVAESGEKGDFVRVGMSTYTTYDGIDAITSSVVAVSGTDFINNQTVSTSYVYNLSLLLGIANNAVNADETITFDEKVINTETFSPTERSVNIVRCIFAIIVPIAVVLTGIIVFVRRKNL